ncbi:MAG: flagellin, partial [Gammaproteobacteria bacterium]|nr:flagellin [Gammaproteobacteria bacterium]
MALVVNTNVHSLAAQRNLTRTMGDLQTAMQRLSSGLRINMAKDDAAGLAVAQRMESQARGASMAQRTIGDGISYLGIADSTLRGLGDSLQRMRELAVQAATGSMS